jgi:Delta3-Delta2-enoyl-CoA isomerase
MRWLRVARDDGLITITIDRGRTHAMDPELVTEIRDTFQELRDDASARAVILTGSGDRFFSNGFDVAALLQLPRADLSRFYEDFIVLCAELYLFPKPLVAAINGHAIAAGLIIALTADYQLIGADNRYVGLTEVQLGLPVPSGTVAMLGRLVGSRVAHRIALCGEMFLPEAAFRTGLVHEVTSYKHLDQVAGTVARDMSARPPEAYAITKRYLRAATAEVIRSTAARSRDDFLECWYLPATQEALRKLVERVS